MVPARGGRGAVAHALARVEMPVGKVAVRILYRGTPRRQGCPAEGADASPRSDLAQDDESRDDDDDQPEDGPVSEPAPALERLVASLLGDAALPYRGSGFLAGSCVGRYGIRPRALGRNHPGSLPGTAPLGLRGRGGLSLRALTVRWARRLALLTFVRSVLTPRAPRPRWDTRRSTPSFPTGRGWVLGRSFLCHVLVSPVPDGARCGIPGSLSRSH